LSERGTAAATLAVMVDLLMSHGIVRQSAGITGPRSITPANPVLCPFFALGKATIRVAQDLDL